MVPNVCSLLHGQEGLSGHAGDHEGVLYGACLVRNGTRGWVEPMCKEVAMTTQTRRNVTWIVVAIVVVALIVLALVYGLGGSGGGGVGY